MSSLRPALSSRQPRREWRAIAWAAWLASSALSGSTSRRSTIAACRRTDAGTMRTSDCGKGENRHPLALEFLRGLAEAPRIKDDLSQAVAACEVTDLADALEHPGVAVVDRRADVKIGVHPDDRRR